MLDRSHTIPFPESTPAKGRRVEHGVACRERFGKRLKEVGKTVRTGCCRL